jgi:UTP--glucose-1-phosphate uridylyltransferase
MPEGLIMAKKAVVPVAGLGTRLWPASQAVKKELMPVAGPDGVARAMLHHQVRALVHVGIEEICIVAQPGDEGPIRAYFSGPGPELRKRLEGDPAQAGEMAEMKRLGERLHFVFQNRQEGYGHAVYQSRGFAGGDMVLLCLGDHLFRGAPVCPYREMAEMAGRGGGRSVSAVNRIGPAELKGYGTIAGMRRRDEPRLIDVSRIVEKPDAETARRELRVDGLGPDEFLGWFGLHLLAPSIYEVLESMIRDNVRDRGEIQLTRAQELLREREGMLALEMVAAERFDFGTPDDYVRSLVRFRGGAEAP